MTKFSDFMKEIEDEAQQEGSAAVAELRILQKHFKQDAQNLLKQLKHKIHYQVVVKGTGEVHDFETKKEATAFIKKCKKQGKKVQLWHTEGFGKIL